MFAAVLFLTVAVSLVSSRHAEAQERTPQQALAAFVASLNAGKPDCSLMVDDLLEEYVSPLLVHQPPFAPRPLTTADRLASCRSLLREQRSQSTEVGTSIRRATVAERTSTLARLSVRVRQTYGSGDRVFQRVEQLVDVWMELENGAWKLVTREYLVPSTEDFPIPPGDLQHWPAYREWLTARATRHRAKQEHRLTAARESARAVAAQPLACDGRVSHAADPPRDVEWSSGGDLVPDQRRPTIDILAASLHSQAGSFCWEVRFTRPPGSSYELSASVFRRSRKPVPL